MIRVGYDRVQSHAAVADGRKFPGAKAVALCGAVVCLGFGRVDHTRLPDCPECSAQVSDPAEPNRLPFREQLGADEGSALGD